MVQIGQKLLKLLSGNKFCNQIKGYNSGKVARILLDIELDLYLVVRNIFMKFGVDRTEIIQVIERKRIFQSNQGL